MRVIKYLIASAGFLMSICPLAADEVIQGTPVDAGEGISFTNEEIHSQDDKSPPGIVVKEHRSPPSPNASFVMDLNQEIDRSLDFDLIEEKKSKLKGKTKIQKIIEVLSAISLNLKPNFLAVQYSQSLYIPPDTMGVVGPNQFIINCNGRIRSFHKTTGHADGVLNITGDAFFVSVRGAHNTIDPRIRYDRFSDRWFLTIGTFAVPGQPNRILIAVSDSGTITLATVWTYFFFEPSAIAPARANPNDAYADFPTLGIDVNALYIGVNVFDNNTGVFLGADAFVINKANLIGGILTVTAFRSVNESTPQGVDNYDATATEGFFAGVSLTAFNTINLIRVFTPGGVPSISAPIPIPVTPIAAPLLVPHLGNNAGAAGFLNALDERLCTTHIRDQQLYTSQNIGVNNVGVSTGVNTRNASRWYQIDVTTPATPVIVQSGNLFNATGVNDGNGRSFWMPSVMTNGLHTIFMGCSTAGAPFFADAAFALHFEGDALGSIRAPVLFTHADTAYNLTAGGPRGRRWGDYSNCSVDPTDNLTLWTIQEYCNATDSWGCQVGRLLSGVPASSITVIPNQVAVNTTTNITINGVRPPGGGFYEPGPSFPKHLAVFIDDVTVNTVTVVNPTQLIVNITTGASTGFKQLIITNPDGQRFATNTAFEVIP